MRFIGFYDYTVILTYLSLVSALLGMRFASQGRIGLAVGCLILSGICDMFDGTVARSKKNRTADEKSFGIQLDSICDVIAFGVAPAVLLYFCGANTVFGVTTLVFYVLCALIRLAFFNVLEINRQMHEDGCAKEYRGLPVTSSSILLPIVFLVGLALPAAVNRVIAHVLPLVIGFLFILDFRIPKIDLAKVLSKKK